MMIMEFKEGIELDTYITRLAGLQGSAIPKYTSDVNEALTLKVEGDDFIALHSPCESVPYWNAFVMNRWEFDDDGHRTPETRSRADTAAMAICLVWLQYIGVRRRIPGLQPEIAKMLQLDDEE